MPPLFFKPQAVHRLTVKLLFLLAGGLNTAAAVTVAAPDVEAVAYLVVAAGSGYHLAEKNIDQRVEPASLTKIMTAYVAAGQMAEGLIAMSDQVSVSEKAWRMGGSRTFIEVGHKVSVNDLLQGIVIQSGNDASVALAEHVAGSEAAFAGLMNRYASELGMNNTHFMNSSGWPHENHYTTARDTAILARALVRDSPDIYALHAVKEFTYNNIKQINRNRLLWQDPSVDGIKTGYTDSAGYCLVASAVRNGIRLMSVVMGTDGPEARIRATRTLLNYSYGRYKTKKLYTANEPVTTIKVWKGKHDSLDLVVEDDLVLTLPEARYEQVQTVISTDENPTAPIEKGQKLGRLELLLDERVIASKALSASAAVASGNIFIRLRDHLRLHWKPQH